jgi:cytoskeleton protein RodZ
VDIQPLVNQLNDPSVVLNKISIPASNEPDKSVTNAEVITDASISVSPVAVSEFDADTTVTTVDKGQLVMLFNDDCWVEVKDGNDNTEITNLLRKDQRIDVFIQVPVQVLLGRASSLTTITFNGMDVDLAPHIRKDIARVTLGQ